MSYVGETSNEAQERVRREKEAVAFLSSLGPQFEKARGTPGQTNTGLNVVGSKTAHSRANGGPVNGPARPAVVNGTASKRNVGSSSSLGGGAVVQVTVSPEVEERRQQALRRLKATHCSVNHDKVRIIHCLCAVLYNSSLY